MSIGALVGVILLWSLLGLGIWAFLCQVLKVPGLADSDGIEFVNPVYLYKHVQVNWFGAIFLATLYGTMSPIGTAIYWLYKLCTVGRR